MVPMDISWQLLLLLFALAVPLPTDCQEGENVIPDVLETQDEVNDDISNELDDDKRFLLTSEICYDDFGCFSNTGVFFNTIKRPVVLLPASPESIGTTFLLFTRNNLASPAQLIYNNADSVLRSQFSARRPTKLVIHGFLGEGVLPWMNSIRQAMLKLVDCNVIQVGWSGGAVTAYNQATSNTRVVGAVVAQMLAWLERRFSVRRSDLHIIGFSLGAHVAGYAGERMRASGPPINRITGLDPAGPYFEGTDPVVRLDPTDAEFVDVIHTDASHWRIGLPVLSGGFGIPSPVGHVDFFVNGGHHQPGCGSISSCDHSRAPELFIATIESAPGAFAAFPCASYAKFLAGECGSRCPTDGCPAMGYWALTQRAKFTASPLPNRHFLLTSAASPFFVMHYHITLRLSATTPSGRVGFLRVSLGRDGRQCGSNQLPGSRSLEPDSQHRGVFTCDWPASSAEPELQISWLDESLLGSVFTRSIQLASVTLVEMASARVTSYCKFGEDLFSDQWSPGASC